MNEISNVLKNKWTQDLCIFDTIHDFWKERSKTKTNDEDDDIVDESSLEKTRQILLQQFSDKLNMRVGDINKLLQLLTNHTVNSATSNYEQNVRTYYEMNPLMTTTAEYITYDDIIDQRGNWDTYISGMSNMVSIEPGTKYPSFGAVMAAKKQNMVAEFIMKYMFPQSNSNVYLTFDAKTGIMRNIFREIEQVFHLITPANVADSASTSFNRLKNGRNIFQFPGEETHQFNSNFFTHDNAKIQFVNNEFSDKNGFGFTLKIAPSNSSAMLFPFSASQSSGPSVNYLVDLLLNKPTNSKHMVNLSSLKNKPALIQEGILFDLKRGGDYEQVNAAKIVSNELGNVLLSTIDILCSVYARTIHQPVIRHLNETMELYRFDKQANMDTELAELIQMKFKVLKLIQNLTLVKNVMENKLIDELSGFHGQCKSFIESGKYYFSSSLKEVKSGVYTQSTPEIIVEKMLKHKLTDILEVFQTIKSQIVEFKTHFTSANLDTIQSDLRVLTQLIDTFGTKIDKQQVKSYIQTQNVLPIIQKYEIQSITGTQSADFVVVNQINQFIQAISSVFVLTNTQSKIMNQGLSALGLDVTLTENIGGTVCWIYYNEITSIKLYVKKYNEFCDSLFKLERVLDRPRHPPFNSVLMDAGYYTQLNALYSMYLNPKLGEIVYNMFSPNQLSDESISAWYKSLPQKTDKLKPSMNKMKTYALPLPPKPVSASKMKRRIEPVVESTRPKRVRVTGGNEDTSVYQYINLNDLLADISSQAAAYLESTMTAYMKQKEHLLSRSKLYNGGTIQRGVRPNGRKSVKHSIPTKFGTLRKTIRNTNTKTTQTQRVSQFIDYLVENKQSEISDLMESLATHFEMGLISLSHNLDELYTYEPSETELYLLCILGMNRDKSSENILYPIEQTKYLFGDINVSRLQVRLNDVYTKYAFSDKIPPEIVNILVFTLIDNLMQTNKEGYFNKFITELAMSMKQKQVNGRSFETKRDWARVVDIVYILIHCVTNNQFIPPKEMIQLTFQGGNGNS